MKYRPRANELWGYMMGNVSRRTVLAGLGGAGVLVATLEGPLSAVAGATGSSGASTSTVRSATAGSVEVRLARIRVQRLFDEDRKQTGFALYASVVDAGGDEIGTFTGTQVGGTLMVHEAVVDDSVVLGMGSGETFAVIGSTGAFAGVTGGYVIELDPDATGDRTIGRITFERTGD